MLFAVALVACLPTISTPAAADTDATEVTSVSAEGQATDQAATDEQTTAIEVPALEELSFRDGGGAPAGEPFSTSSQSPAASGLPAAAADHTRQIDASYPTDTTSGSGYSTLDEWYGDYGYDDYDSGDYAAYGYPASTYGALAGPEYAAYEPVGGYRGRPSRGRRTGWSVDGSIALGTGSASFADNDFQEFFLRESLNLLNGDHYEFYQEYAVDHSYFNSTTLTLGARQRLRDWLADGDLRLIEEFRLYRDRDSSSNDRQEGYFSLAFDPEWYCGRLRADLDYRYRIRVYEAFSTRSYIHNSARAGLFYDLTPGLETAVRTRFDDYNFSAGSTRSHNRHSIGNEWEWQATPELLLQAGVEQQRKSYNTTKDRSYDRRSYEAGVRWDASDATRIEVRGEAIDYDREFDPEESYEDTQGELRVRHELAEWADLDLRVGERQKEYDLNPLDDLDQSLVEVRLNLNPDRRWNVFANVGEVQYDFAQAARAFSRRDAGLGVNYWQGAWRAGADYYRREYSFAEFSSRNYSRDDINLDLGYRLDRQRWRVYYGIALLDQDDPASVNGYEETRAGAQWDYKLDSKTQLELRYETSDRNYDALGSIDYSLLEARLEFEL